MSSCLRIFGASSIPTALAIWVSSPIFLVFNSLRFMPGSCSIRASGAARGPGSIRSPSLVLGRAPSAAAALMRRASRVSWRSHSAATPPAGGMRLGRVDKGGQNSGRKDEARR